MFLSLFQTTEQLWLAGKGEIWSSHSEVAEDPGLLWCYAVLLGEKYRDADKSLARPGRKHATATEDFDVHISYLIL